MSPFSWLVEFDELVKPDVWQRVFHVVCEQPVGHYASCATPITSQAELDKVLRRVSALREVRS